MPTLNSLSGPWKQNGKLTMPLLVLLVICFFGRAGEAQYGDGNDVIASAQTSTYVFLSDQSTVVKTGGIAGVHEIYPIEGQFRLSVDFNGGTALFSQVDANLIDESGLLYERSLGVIFNMAELLGTVVDDTTIEFVGKTADGMESDILLMLTFRVDSAHLTGRTVPPPNSADFFIFELDAVAGKKYGGGTGEPNNPYLIYTAEQMNAIGLHEDDWDKHFKLMANVDLLDFDGKEGRPPFNMIAPDTNMAKIRFQGTPFPFTGVFDGNGYTISNFFYINTERDYAIGLFGCVEEENAEIKNLGLIDPNVDAGTANYVGSLVGWLRWGTITNCYVEGGSVSGDYSVGGIAGYNSGTIINCYANGSVMGNCYVGGMVGFNLGRITNCCASSVVIGNKNVGGMVGRHGRYDSLSPWSPDLGRTDKIYLFPDLGRRDKISNCYSTGDVLGGDRVGGLAGEQTPNSTITNCYSTGSVSGNVLIGGLVGAMAPPPLIVIDLWGITPDTISDFYSTADITVDGGVGQPVIIGFIPDVNNFWDTETSGQHTSARGIGKTTAEMQTASTFLEAGWDFVGETANGTEDVWWILEGQDYPRLIWELPEGLRLQPLPAFSPNPQDGATDVTQSPILHWAPAEPTLQHDIYLGEDKEEVANATTLSLGIYRGRHPGELTTYEPGKLEWDATYYWRIDEVNEADPNSLCKGSVWSFTTADFLIVDDFESYNRLDSADPNSNSIFDTWIAVLETTTIELDVCGHPGNEL
jgi:hypothetical protein